MLSKHWSKMVMTETRSFSNFSPRFVQNEDFVPRLAEAVKQADIVRKRLLRAKKVRIIFLFFSKRTPSSEDDQVQLSPSQSTPM